MAKIAVLVPSYKPKDYIVRCFESLDSQSIDKRLFCVYVALNGSGCSDDAYIQSLLNEFGFEFKYIFITEPGVSNARNVLLDVSVEDYIVFLDDDDFFSESYLECLLDVALPGYLSVSNVRNYIEGGVAEVNYIGKAFDSLKDRERSHFRIRKYFSSPMGKLIHRDMIGEIRFDERLAKGEDSLFMAQISAGVQGVRKADTTACYHVRIRAGSASRKRVSFGFEVKRLGYLLVEYARMLFRPGYDKVFIVTRIVATARHAVRLLY